MAMQFKAREFTDAQSLASFIDLTGGAVVPVSIVGTVDGRFILFSNEDPAGFETKKDAIAHFEDHGPGRGMCSGDVAKELAKRSDEANHKLQEEHDAQQAAEQKQAEDEILARAAEIAAKRAAGAAPVKAETKKKA